MQNPLLTNMNSAVEKSSKLIASMNNKTKYVIHEMNLKQAV